MAIYGYKDSNFSIEARMIPLGVSFLEQYYPRAELELIESYTNTNRDTKELQDKHVDCILHLPAKDIFIDFKCYNSDCLRSGLIELQRVNSKDKTIREGWIEITDISPPQDQIIMNIASKEILLFDKASAHRVMERYPSDFDTKKLKWVLDSGSTDDYQVYKRNKCLFFGNDRHVKLLQEMNAKKYHLTGDRWQRVALTDKIYYNNSW